MNKTPQHLFEFGPFQLDPMNHLLLRLGEPVSLPPKAFDTLLLLVQRRGALLEREELLKTVWPDTFVEENNLTHYISMLRKALGDGENGDGFIETVPKLGYRFVADVRQVDGSSGELLLAKHTKTHIVIHEQEEPLAKPVSQTAGSALSLLRTSLSNHRYTWLAVLAVAGILLVFTTTRYFRKPVRLTARDTILLADFENSTGDDVFDAALKRALAVKLEESPFLNVLSDQRARETLRYMGRPPDQPLTSALAREVCQRRGAKAFVAGSIARLGSQYVLALEATNCETGDSLAREQADALTPDQVLQAMGSATSRLRGKLGESLSSLQKFDAPISEATTPSLEALKAFSLGDQIRAKGQQIESIPFFERAVALDPNFAMAYGRLSAVYLGIGEPDRASQYSKKAFDLRERCSEREKLILSGSYFHTGIGDLEKAVSQYQIWTQSYPRDFTPHVNLAALYNDAGQFDRAIAEGREGLRLNPGHALAYNTLAWAALRSNRVDDARSIFEKAVSEKIDNTMMHRGLYTVAFLQQNLPALQRESTALAGKPDEFRSLVFQAQAAALSGKLTESRELYRRSADLALKNHFADAAAAITAGHALVEASFGNFGPARQEARRALQIARGRDALGMAAAAFALSGDMALAQQSIAELTHAFPSDTLVNSVSVPAARAAVALYAGQPDQALQLLLPASNYELGPMVFGQGYLAPYFRALAYLRVGKANEARDAFQHILDNGAAAPFAPLKALAHLGLARACMAAGDRDRSRLAFQDFLTLWKDADPSLALLRQAKSEFAKLR